MRGYLLLLLIFGWLPFILFKPHVGILVWGWISHMIPQSTSPVTEAMPVLDSIAALSIIGLFISKEPREVPWHPNIVMILMFFFWCLISLIFSYDPAHSSAKFIQLFKVVLFVLVAAIVMQSPNRLKAYFLVMALSVGFFAIKGGLFTAMTGGSARVQGPGGQYVDNNQFALALSMVIPMAYYYFLHPPMKILKWPMFASIFISFLAVVGTNSRAGLMAGLAVLGMLYMNMKKGKLLVIALLIPALIGGWQALPDRSKERYMSTLTALGIGSSSDEVIEEEEEGGDASMFGRLVMWKYAQNVVQERPFTGGGFNIHYHKDYKDVFMPIDHKIMAWHSIYFEVLGETGYVGLLLYMTMIFTAWYTAGTTYKKLSQHEDLMWLADMAKTLRLCLVGFCVAGLSVNVFSLGILYDVCMIMALASVVGDKILATRETTETVFDPFAVQNAHDFHKEQVREKVVEEDEDDDPYGLKKSRMRKKKKAKWTPHGDG